MALPPGVISVGLFLCEKALSEKDGVTSAIRIIDIFYATERPEGLPKEIQTTIDSTAILLVKCEPGSAKEYEVSTRLIGPDGSGHDVGAKHRFSGTSKIGSAPGGLTARIHLSIQSAVFGTYYLCALLDGEEVSRAPFSILRRPQTKQNESEADND